MGPGGLRAFSSVAVSPTLSSAVSASTVVATTPSGAPPLVEGPLATVISVAPVPICIGMFLSPWGTIKQIKDSGTTGQLDALPFTSMATNCFTWSLYGGLLQDLTAFLPNFVGLLLGSYYTYIYTKHAPQAPVAHFAVGGGIAVAMAGCAATLPTPDAMWYIGMTGCACAVTLMASPLSVITKVIKEKSTKSMPGLTMSLAVLANSTSWALFGSLMLHDPMIYLPNALGFAAACTQLACYWKYGLPQLEEKSAAAGDAEADQTNKKEN